MRIQTVVMIVALTLALTLSECRFRPPTVGFWFDEGPFPFPSDVAARLGGPLSDTELASIERLSQQEVERAFAGLSVVVTGDHNAFWRVRVMPMLPTGKNQALPRAGESLALGMLGGTGAVGFDFVSFNAVQFAPAGASRQTVLDGIGRGIGRVAVHEFMHQILGASSAHNDSDPDSFESGRADRPSQYYGELHWTTALPLLRQKFGEQKF